MRSQELPNFCMNNPHYNSSPADPRKVPRDFRVKVILLMAVFVFSCFTAIRALVETWSVQDVYSYGYLVPVFSLLWIWHEKENFRHLPIKPALISGMIVLLAGGLMLILGVVGGSSMLQELAIVVIMPGLVLMLLGTQYLVALSLPLSYLILMVPVLDVFLDKLYLPFQMFAAVAAEKILHTANIPVFRNGLYLELPNITLEVASECSGVRFLISMMALCIPLAFITQKSWVQRLLLFLFAIFISVVSNPLRVTFVAVWAYYGSGDIHGPLHIFQGYVVYLIGMAVLFWGAWILQKIPFLNKERIQKTARTRTEDFSDFNKLNQALMASLVVLLGIGAYIHLFKSEPVPLKMSLNELPVTLGEWRSSDTENDVQPLAIPGADVELARVYRNALGREIKLQISYFESQRQDKKLVYYKLQRLNANSEVMTVSKDLHTTERVNKTVRHDGTQNSFILFWYDINGRIVAGRAMAKTILALNGLVHGRTNGAVIIVSSPTIADGVEMTQRTAVSFVQQLLPVLDTIIP